MGIAAVFRRGLLLLAACALVGVADARAQEGDRARLPQDHEYQVVLRDYMATLTEEDFEHGVDAEEFAIVEDVVRDREDQFRQLVMGSTPQPMVGFKRGIPAINAPAHVFLLSNIEGPLEAPSREEIVAGFEAERGPARIRPGPIAVPTGIVRPPVWPDALVSFTQWDDPENHFYDNAALKRCAFVNAAVRMIMVDDYFSQGNQNRSDWNAYKMVTFAYTYMGVKDMLPTEVQEAYETGLRRLGERLLEWGPTREDVGWDYVLPLAMWYASQASDDPEFSERAAALGRAMLSDPEYFHPAGYYVERGGGIDIGFAGMANNFVSWTALAADWPEAKDALSRVYRLRTHLILPEPDGTLNGPSHFNSRLGSPPHDDQWGWGGARDLAAFLATDEAAFAVALMNKRPTEEALEGAIAGLVSQYNSQVYGHMRNPYNGFRSPEVGNYGYLRNEDIRGSTWQWRMVDTYNYPLTVNPGMAYYPEGSYARYRRLEQESPEIFESPYVRGENFVRNFADAFIATRQDDYAAILHTGPVGKQDPNDARLQYKGPMGFGGGQLSAFWTPETGSLLLGMRSGMSAHENFDTPEIWRQWPIHAVTGITAEGDLISSARILQPTVESDLADGQGSVTVTGVFPAEPFETFGQGHVLSGEIAYRRTFTIQPDAVRVETSVTGDGQDALGELYETLPVLLTTGVRGADTTPTTIAFQVDGEWTPATTDFHDAVTAIRLSRFEGAVDIAFDAPQRVALAPEPWQGTYLNRSTSQPILIDLLGNDGEAAALEGERSVAYVIRAAAE